jgi:hypothetical protein
LYTTTLDLIRFKIVINRIGFSKVPKYFAVPSGSITILLINNLRVRLAIVFIRFSAVVALCSQNYLVRIVTLLNTVDDVKSLRDVLLVCSLFYQNIRKDKGLNAEHTLAFWLNSTFILKDQSWFLISVLTFFAFVLGVNIFGYESHDFKYFEVKLYGTR